MSRVAACATAFQNPKLDPEGILKPDHQGFGLQGVEFFQENDFLFLGIGADGKGKD
jgi:hypothetical protein